jgi:phosphoglycolate phosphatase
VNHSEVDGPTHVLLDLDGTISDSSPGIARSLQHAFAACGYEPPSDEQVRTVIGPPFEIGLPALGIPVDDVERVVLAYRERYEDIGLFENTVYAGISEMLATLAAAGHTLSIATAKPEPTARRIIEHFGFADHFARPGGSDRRGRNRTSDEGRRDQLRLGLPRDDPVGAVAGRDGG